MSSISRDLTVPLSASDGFSIAISAVPPAGQQLKKIEYSIDQQLDGIQSVLASGTTAKLTQLQNKKYLITAVFTDNTRASMKVDSVSVPSTPLLLKSYTPDGGVSEDDFPGAGTNVAFLQGIDNGLKLIAGSLSSPSLSEGKDAAAVAAMAVSAYDILLSNGDEVQSFVVTPAQAESGHELTGGFIANYVALECVIIARNSLGDSLPSAVSEAMATNFPNQPGQIGFYDQDDQPSDKVKIQIPMPSDYAEWASNSSFLTGSPSSDLILQNGEEQITVRVYNEGEETPRLIESVGVPNENFVDALVDCALGEVVKLRATVSNALGTSLPSPWSIQTLNMRPSLFQKRTYTISSYSAAVPGDSTNNKVSVTGSARTTMYSTGLDTSLLLDAPSGVPIINTSGNILERTDSERLTKNGTHNTFSTTIGYGATTNAGEALVSGQQMQFKIESRSYIPPDSAYTTKWDHTHNKIQNKLFLNTYTITGFGSIPRTPDTKCIDEFSEAGSSIQFELAAEGQIQYGLSNYVLALSAAQGEASYSDSYSITDVTAASQHTLSGLVAGVALTASAIMSAQYSLASDDEAVDVSGMQNVSIDSTSQAMTKGQEAFSKDEEQLLGIVPFGTPDPLSSAVLSIETNHDGEVGLSIGVGGGNGRSVKRLRVVAYNQSAEGVAPSELNSFILHVSAAPYVVVHATSGSSNGDNTFYKISVINNSYTSNSAQVDTNIVVPYGDPTYSVSVSGKTVTTSLQCNGRRKVAEYVFAIDSQPDPSDTDFLQEHPAITNGVLGVRPSADNVALITKAYTFSTFDSDIVKYFAKVDMEAGSVAPISAL